jgi:hypothetical protein
MWQTIGELVRMVDKSCTVDADCVLYDAGGGPCANVTTAATAQVSFQAELDAVDARFSPGLAASCPPSNLGIECPRVVAQCVAGTCRMNTELDCDQAHSDIAQLMLDAEAMASRDCAVDADCTRVPRANACYDGCTSNAIALSAAEPLLENFAAIGQAHCESILISGCATLIPPCPSSPEPPVCDQGQCR